MKDENETIQKRLRRREFIRKAAVGTIFVAIGGNVFRLADSILNQQALAEERPDGRKRLPPGQRVVEQLPYGGGQPGNSRTEGYQLKVYGEVNEPFTLNYAELTRIGQERLTADVHCVTGWSYLGGIWTGVTVKKLAEKAGLKPTANFVIFECAHGYTANITLAEALKPNVMVATHLNDRPFQRLYGAPVRSLVPDLYFWKSAKWLEGIRFTKRDEPGFWETRGYHNVGDPWKEQRFK